MNFIILLAVIAAMIALRFVRLNPLLWLVVWWAGIFVVLRYAIEPPLPMSIVSMFMGIITIALLVFMSADSARLGEAKNSIVAFLVHRRYNIPLLAFLLLLPTLVAVNIYRGYNKAPSAPLVSRTIHPPPPTQISFKGRSINLNLPSPIRTLETSDPAAFAERLENGSRVYFENCVYCHGDNMDGNGIFAHALNPIPANFRDASTIAILQESYLFWRIAKGAPGLPSEATPWASAMPAWENFLTEDEIWDVTAFLYDYTDQRPRSTEGEH